MLYLVLAGILLLATIICFALGPIMNHRLANYSGREYDKPVSGTGFYIGGTVCLAVLLIYTFIASATSVEARSVGVQTSFGRFDGTLDGGLHWIAPWSEVEQFDTTIQTVDLADDANDKGGKVQVAFKGGGGGWVNATARWSTTKESVEPLWQSYRSFATATNSLVNTGTRDAVINAANDFTALEARSDQAAVAAKVVDNLRPTLSKYGIVLDSVSIVSIPLDDKTQGSLDAVVVAANNVEKAKQDEQRAIIDVRTAKLRSEGAAVTPDLNQRYCLDILNVWDQAKNGPLPATLNCGLGGQSPVLVGTR